MKCLIVVNGYFTSEAYDYQVTRIINELQKKGVQSEIYRNNRAFSPDVNFDCDFCIFLDKDINLAECLEGQGIKLFNSAAAIKNADSKIKTTIILNKTEDIKMQKTLFAPKKYNSATDIAFLNQVADRLGFPLVFKSAYGSRGEQVKLINNIEELIKIDEKYWNEEHLYQEYRNSSAGKSVRVIVVGGKAIGAIKLENTLDFRSNAYLGGKGSVFELTDEYKSVSEKVSKAMNLDYCGVDLFCDKPIVIEVNSNAYFKEFEEKTGINTAEIFAEYIMENIND